MHIILFGHPSFLNHQSMPRYVKMLYDGMKERGHQVEVWSPQAIFSRVATFTIFKKWFGYIDQFLIFPLQVNSRVKKCNSNTLFVFTDHALGPWVPLVTDRPHVIHCHDFLAQLSAIGKIRENPISFTGKVYQSFIRWGYSKGNNFISVSEKTRTDLNLFVRKKFQRSEMVYNGISPLFRQYNSEQARKLLQERITIELSQGFILHVGGNQWYKNRVGVIEIYNAWRSSCNLNIPLLLIGEKPSKKLLEARSTSPYVTSIVFLDSIDDKEVRIAYSAATIFLFPSLAEGFGWPIIEAMACGCPVITTAELPMSEITGKSAFLIARRPYDKEARKVWATDAASIINHVLNLAPTERNRVITAGLQNVERFNLEKALDKIEKIYLEILAESNNWK